MKTRLAPSRPPELKTPSIAAPVAVVPVAPPVAEPALPLPAVPAATETQTVPADQTVDPVFRLDRLMFHIWLIGAGILVLLSLLDAFYHILLRL
jgi:hypothetical protein